MAKDPILDAINPMPKSDDADREDRIRRRAYQLWDAAGQPGGREREHWFTAESEEASRNDSDHLMGAPVVPLSDSVNVGIGTGTAAILSDEGDLTLRGVDQSPPTLKTAGAPMQGADTSKSRVANRDLEGPRKAGATPRPTSKPIR